MPFDRFHLHPLVANGVASAGYTTPTPIQAAALPVALSGRDVLGLAQTGTGKTAAFGLPLLHRLITCPPPKPTKAVRALIIAPTRELAKQICTALSTLAQHAPVRTVMAYGGVSLARQRSEIAEGADVVVGCPGRLLDLLRQEALDLGAVEVLVLDEADTMLGMGFLPDVKALLWYLPKQRQSMMFSATMTTQVGSLAREILRNPQEVKVDHIAPATTVSHALYPVEDSRKTALLLRLLEPLSTGSILVFTKSKKLTERLCRELVAAGYSAASMQGNLAQGRREKALEGFRTGTHRILVATDVASRGLDISQVTHVINYDMPACTDDYIHRVGRTGRAAATGTAFTFVTPWDDAAIQRLEKLMGRPLPRHAVEGFETVAELRERRTQQRLVEEKRLREEAAEARQKRQRTEASDSSSESTSDSDSDSDSSTSA